MHDTALSISTVAVGIALLAGGAGSLRGQTWVQTSAPAKGWVAVACSADGQRIAAAAWQDTIYASTDSGITWTNTGAPVDGWSCLASSADGMKLMAAVTGGLIYNSTNSGASWTPCSLPTNSWRVITSSADGTRLAAGFTRDFLIGGLYISTNSGATWTLSNTVTNDCLSLASSPDGTQLIAVTRDIASPGGYLGHTYRSTNSGDSWTRTSGNTALNLVASSDGLRAVMAVGAGGGMFGTGGGMFVTTNSGADLQLTGAPNGPWSSLATSADGQRAVAVIGQEGGINSMTGPIYTSLDSGRTWSLARAPTNNCWSSVASSADGRKLFAVANYDFQAGNPPLGGLIYTLQSTPAPLLNIHPSGTNLLLSWTVPSRNFVLQETSDLSTGSWVESSVTPILNYATLQFEVTVPKQQEATFYRLVSR